MKIGRDEIGLLGIIGLILMGPSMFLAVYAFLIGYFPLDIIGTLIFVIAVVAYYSDLFQHRKRKTRTDSLP